MKKLFLAVLIGVFWGCAGTPPAEEAQPAPEPAVEEKAEAKAETEVEAKAEAETPAKEEPVATEETPSGSEVAPE